MIQGSTKRYFSTGYKSTIMNLMTMTYPVLEYQGLDFLNYLPNFSNRQNLKQSLKNFNN